VNEVNRSVGLLSPKDVRVERTAKLRQLRDVSCVTKVVQPGTGTFAPFPRAGRPPSPDQRATIGRSTVGDRPTVHRLAAASGAPPGFRLIAGYCMCLSGHYEEVTVAH
jgi:hypothetical protein